MSIDNLDTAESGAGPKTSELRTEAEKDLGHATETAKHDLDAISQQAKQDFDDIKHEAGARAGEAAGKAKSFASDQKALAAGQINGVASAINRVADELDGSDQQTVGRYARDLASGLSGLGKTIEERDVDDLMGMAQDFGRKQPIAFLGAAALAGFVASRFAIASTHRRQTKTTSTGGTSSYQAATAQAATVPTASQGAGDTAGAGIDRPTNLTGGL
jgi:vacuolar-type H+-ATPase subunit H